MTKQLLIIFLILTLCSCNQSEINPSESNPNSSGSKEMNIAQSMPNEMPNEMTDDFGFSIRFGVGKRNEINTFEGIVTKDLLTAGAITAKITLTEKELEEIYEKMEEINIVETKKLIPSHLNESICVQEPYEEDEWKIIINGETFTQSVSGTYCEPTMDAKQLLKIRNYVFNIIKSKDAYKELPESEGAYQ
ncbi:hypothetical protein ACLM5H_10855 [Fredinandcohnia humi]